MARGPREYEVEHIVKAKVLYKRKSTITWSYLVKWQGYNEKDNTWEPESSFESSPGLIKSFWKKADTKGRDHTKPKLFKAREEINLHEGVPMSDTDADGEDDDQEEENVSPKARGKKRPGPAVAADGTMPKRKRGRPSKANKDTDEQAKGDDKDKSESLGEDKDDVSSRRNSRRLSEQTHESLSSEERVNELLHQPRSFPCSSEGKRAPTNYIRSESSSEDSEPEEPVAPITHIKKSRKAYIESDDEDEVAGIVQDELENSSHDGSLFSGDEDEDEQEKTNVEMKHNAKGPGPSTAPKVTSKSILEPSRERNPIKMPLPTAPHRPGRPARPRMMMLDDPSIKEALEKRVHNRTHGPSAKSTDTSGKNKDESGSNMTTGQEKNAERQAGPSATSPLSPGTGRKNGGTYRPTLLTFEKGKLTSQRRKGEHDPVQQLPKPSSNIRAGSEGHTRGAERQSLEKDYASAMDTTQDLGVSADTLDGPSAVGLGASIGISESESFEITTTTEIKTVVSTEEVEYTGPPPTVDELLRLAGVRDTLDDLPDFSPDEESGDGDVAMTGVEATSSAPSGAEKTLDSTTTPEKRAWKQSDIFNTPTPLASLKSALAKSPNQPTPATTPRASIPLHLSANRVVHVELKDMIPAHGNIGLSNLTDSEPSILLPGKLYSLDVLDHITLGGPSARVVLTEGMSDQQRLWFASLLDALEKDCVFLTRIGKADVALCASSNWKASQRLWLPSALDGLSKTVIVTLITITDNTGFEHFSREAKLLNLD